MTSRIDNFGSQPVTGAHRGEVVAVRDPEKRGRIRVKIPYVHSKNTQPAHLPWAEIASFGGRLFGDFHANYQVGDLVWVIFEGGKREKPVVIGGWISERDGIHDLTADQVQDYETQRLRWVRQDRSGNRIELSEVPGEERVRLRSGQAIIDLSKNDDSILMESTSDVVSHARHIVADATQSFTLADDVLIQAKGVNDEDESDGLLGLYSNDEARLNAQRLIRVGQYTDDEGEARQTEEYVGQARTIRIGVKSPDDGTERTIDVTIEAHDETHISANHRVSVEAPRIRVEAQDRLDLSGTNQVTVQSDNRIVFTAPRFDVFSG